MLEARRYSSNGAHPQSPVTFSVVTGMVPAPSLPAPPCMVVGPIARKGLFSRELHYGRGKKSRPFTCP
jgi:hypothetical protein